MIRSRDEFNQISEKVINGTANKSEQKAYEEEHQGLTQGLEGKDRTDQGRQEGP